MKLLGLLFASFVFATISRAEVPSILLKYSWVFDSWCAAQTGVEIKQIERERLAAKFLDLQAAWNKTGPALLAQTEKTIGKPFYEKEMIATVFLCKKTPSMSMPLLINGNWFVSDAPMPTDIVADIIYHELMHTYLVDHFPNLPSSPLLTKYGNEDPGVLSHLHLMALQKTVYLELGLKERIAKVIEFDSEHYKGAYKRSWEIVIQEGADKFVAELK